MNDEQMLKIRALMPNFAGIGTDKRTGKDSVIFYHISGQGQGEPQYDVPISELIDIVDYLRIFHPHFYKPAVQEAKVTEELDKLI